MALKRQDGTLLNFITPHTSVKFSIGFIAISILSIAAILWALLALMWNTIRVVS